MKAITSLSWLTDGTPRPSPPNMMGPYHKQGEPPTKGVSEYKIVGTHGVPRVEAGAQGEHKIQRGYLPTPTYSAHWIRDPGLKRAVAEPGRRAGEVGRQAPAGLKRLEDLTLGWQLAHAGPPVRPAHGLLGNG